jgi:aminoglycoside phosphotransferase (APT) family kinase protein
MHDVGVEKGEITADVASRLIAEQFPQWSHLAVTPVELDGWDNTTLASENESSLKLWTTHVGVPRSIRRHPR